MVLWVGRFRGQTRPAGLDGLEVFEHFSSYVAFQYPDDLSDRLAFFGSSFHIPLGFGV